MANIQVLKDWFERVDSDKTGNITTIQLQRALAVGNLQFPITIVQQMIRMYDFDRNGTMSFQEFVALNKFLLKVQQAFSDLERGRGFLVPDEVYKALLKLDISLDSPAFYTVCESFDKEKNGKFRLDDLISLCIFVQSARNLFNSFDTSKQGRVTLDLNQFVYCSDNVIVGSKDGKLCWFDMDLSSKPYKILKCHPKDLTSVAFHCNYPLFASCSDDCTTYVFHGMVYSDLMQFPLIVPLEILHGHESVNGRGVLDCKFHPRQPWLCTAGADAVIKLFCY